MPIWKMFLSTSSCFLCVRGEKKVNFCVFWPESPKAGNTTSDMDTTNFRVFTVMVNMTSSP